MAQNIILKRSAIPGKIPNTASLQLGEFAVNTYDGKAFFKQSGSTENVLTILAANESGAINVTGSLFATASLQITGSVFLIGPTRIVNQPTTVDQNDFFLIKNANTTFKVSAGVQITSSAQTPLTVMDQTNSNILTVSQSGLLQLKAQPTPPTASAPEGALWFTNNDLYISLT